MLAPQSEYDDRIQAVRLEMAKRGLDLLVVYSGPGAMRYGQRGHVLYLSGHEPYFGDCMLLLTRDPNHEPVLELDSAGHYSPLVTWIKDVREPCNHTDLLKSYIADCGLTDLHIGLVGEYSMSPTFYNKMLSQVDAEFVLASDIVEYLRAVKSPYEMDCMRQAGAIAYEGIKTAQQATKPGISEAELKAEIEAVCRRHGAEAFPHYTMVTAGLDGDHAKLWWRANDGVCASGEPWLLDFGTSYKSYCCDIARVFTLGKPSSQLQEMFDLMYQSLLHGCEILRPGATSTEVNDATGEAAKKYFGDNLQLIWGQDAEEGEASEWWGVGHGVGIEVHEFPFIGYHHITDDDIYRAVTLQENMVISIEPTIYTPETGPIQLEDQFIVTPQGGKQVSPVPFKLFECSA